MIVELLVCRIAFDSPTACAYNSITFVQLPVRRLETVSLKRPRRERLMLLSPTVWYSCVD